MSRSRLGLGEICHKYHNTRSPHSLYIYLPVIPLQTVTGEETAGRMNVSEKTLKVSDNVSDEKMSRSRSRHGADV